MQLSDDQLATVSGGGRAAFRAGKHFGFNAGVAVTEALAHVPGWNQQVPGKPTGFEKRHESVVGPQIASFAQKIMPGAVQDFFRGAGRGATMAPPWSFEHGL